MQDHFITDRLVLNLITEPDYSFIRKLVNTDGWLQFIGDRKVLSDEEAIAYIQKIQSTANLFYWVVRRKQDDIPIGIISFLKRHYLDHFDIGFAFLPEFEGKGYAFEATDVVLAKVMQSNSHRTVVATSIPGNTRSIRLLKKLGFEFVKEICKEGNILLVFSIGQHKDVDMQ